MNNSQPQIAKIAIANIWHDDNKGDCGIVVGMIEILQHHYPQAEFTLISMFAESSPFFKDAHRHLQQHFPDLKIVPSPFFSHDISETESIYQKLAKLFPIPLSLLYLQFPLFTRQPGLQVLKTADLVITPGGQYLLAKKNQFKSLYVLYRFLYPLLIAQKHNIPYLFFSQSFDFYSPERFDSRLIKSVLNKAIAVFAREPLSYQALLESGVYPNKVKLVPDGAILLKPQKTELVTSLLTKHNLNQNQFWVVTVKNCGCQTESWLKEMAKLIEKLFAQGIISQLVLVANSQGPTIAEDDRLVTRQLAKNSERSIVVIEDDLTPNELAAIYGEAQFLIGTRFQSLILALASGTPVYGISYAGFKVEGLMNMLEMSELWSSVAEFEADTFGWTIFKHQLSQFESRGFTTGGSTPATAHFIFFQPA